MYDILDHITEKTRDRLAEIYEVKPAVLHSTCVDGDWVEWSSGSYDREEARFIAKGVADELGEPILEEEHI